MPTYDLLALTPVTASGRDAKHATDTARDALDTAHQHLDDTTPANNLETGPTTLLDRGALTGLLHLIRGDALDLRNGSALTRTVPAGRIIARVDQLLAALEPHRATPHEPAPPDTANGDPAHLPDLLRGVYLLDTIDGQPTYLPAEQTALPGRLQHWREAAIHTALGGHASGEEDRS